MSNFKLINFLEDTRLNGLRYEMGAKLIQSSVGSRKVDLLDPDALRRLGQEGIDIDDFSHIKIEHDKTLSYKGKRVVIYIRDVKEYKDNQSLPKYHFSFCTTLEQMRQNNRWHRYVVANREDGVFVVNFVGDRAESKTMRLNVCQNCLALISWDGFSYALPKPPREVILRAFSLSRFFERFPKDLLSVVPRYTVDTAPLNDYSEDWGLISEGLKRRRGYCCEKCNLQLAGADRMYIHVHHRDGDKTNNTDGNLEVLCIRCHAETPMHSHLKANPQYLSFIAKYR